ncbi:YTX2 protein, partial [Polypterus senegalus]
MRMTSWCLWILMQTSPLCVSEGASSAKVNWEKGDAYLSGDWAHRPPPVLPSGLGWNRKAYHYLGVVLGGEDNWEGFLQRIDLRLKKWQWIATKLSVRGRVLLIKNLVASMLWHRLRSVDPPAGLLHSIQTLLVDFFWNGMHRLKKGLLSLPVEEGGRGLMMSAARPLVSG